MALRTAVGRSPPNSSNGGRGRGPADQGPVDLPPHSLSPTDNPSVLYYENYEVPYLAMSALPRKARHNELRVEDLRARSQNSDAVDLTT